MPELSNKTYDRVKWFVQIVLPAFGAAYFALGDLLGIPGATVVPGVVTIVVTFLGTILGLSSRQYNKSDRAYDGYVEIEEDPGGVKTANLVVEGDPETMLASQNEMRFRINHGGSSSAE